MDWIQGIQNAIDYIEEYINDDIDYDKVAKAAYSSSYHFQRIFGISWLVLRNIFTAFLTEMNEQNKKKNL